MMLRGNKDWNRAAKVMEALVKQWGEGNVMLAGGALRDLLHDKQPKDWDFFVKVSNTGGYAQHWDIDIVTERIPMTTPVYGEYENEEWKVYTSKDKKIQVIFVTLDLKDVVDDFDLSICKLYYKHGKGIMYLDEYLKGEETKNIVISPLTTATRKNRIKELYPEYSLFLPLRKKIKKKASPRWVSS